MARKSKTEFEKKSDEDSAFDIDAILKNPDEFFSKPAVSEEEIRKYGLNLGENNQSDDVIKQDAEEEEGTSQDLTKKQGKTVIAQKVYVDEESTKNELRSSSIGPKQKSLVRKTRATSKAKAQAENSKTTSSLTLKKKTETSSPMEIMDKEKEKNTPIKKATSSRKTVKTTSITEKNKKNHARNVEKGQSGEELSKVDLDSKQKVKPDSHKRSTESRKSSLSKKGDGSLDKNIKNITSDAIEVETVTIDKAPVYSSAKTSEKLNIETKNGSVIMKEWNEGIESGARVFGGKFKFMLAVTGIFGIGAINMLLLSGALDGVLFGIALLIGLYVLIKVLRTR